MENILIKEEVILKTKDGIKIAADYYKNGSENVVIIAPGWCMTKDSNAFRHIAEMFAQYFDVLSFDFRGHGKSSGWFTFMAKETLDIESVVEFAKKQQYKNINVIGFSLGAGTVLIHSALKKNVNKIIAVSAPVSFSKIENKMWKKEAWIETFKKFELSRFLSIRPDIIPRKKINPYDIIKQIEVPTLFIAGEKDPTVCAWHAEKLYKTAVCQKAYKLFANGCHAEDLFLHFENEFSKICVDWFTN